MDDCNCFCDSETNQCNQPRKAGSRECPVQWNLHTQNIHVRFLVQQEGILNKIYLFDQNVAQILTISVQWDANQRMVFGNTISIEEKQRYQKILKSKPTSARELIRDVVLNFNGTSLVVWPVWRDESMEPHVYVINYDSASFGTNLQVSFSKTMRRQGVRFHQPSKSLLSLILKTTLVALGSRTCCIR